MGLFLLPSGQRVMLFIRQLRAGSHLLPGALRPYTSVGDYHDFVGYIQNAPLVGVMRREPKRLLCRRLKVSIRLAKPRRSIPASLVKYGYERRGPGTVAI